MGKPTGFLEYPRELPLDRPPRERVLDWGEFHDHQTEDEQVAEHEAAFQAEGQTVMVVPTELVPAIVKLIGTKRPA